MLSFRKKLFLSYLLIFFLCLAAVTPFVSHSVKALINQSLKKRSQMIITEIQSAPNRSIMIDRLKTQRFLVFFRITLLDSQQHILYDTHLPSLIGPRFSPEYIADHPEVQEAINTGQGYSEGYSKLLNMPFIYRAVAFKAQGQTYILRTAFPLSYVNQLIKDMRHAFWWLSAILLLIFAIMTWTMFFHLSRPIRKIIAAINPQQEQDIPKIYLKGIAKRKDEFGLLASILNSLSNHIQENIITLRNERNQKETILESLIEGVIAVDNNLVVTYINQKALQLLDARREDILYKNFNLVHRPLSNDLLEHALNENRVFTTSLKLNINNKKLFLDVVATPTADHQGAILILQDKSIHYRALEMKKDFIANASHELKTPITIIRGFAETLHDNPLIDVDYRKKITSKIMRNCERMTSLINSLLALANIEKLPLTRIQSIDLIDLIKRCKASLLVSFPSAEITISDNDSQPLYIKGDPELLELAINNILTNAAKYSSPPAKITLSVEKTTDAVIISISDKGIGIPKKDLDNIFSRFYRVDKARSRQLGGSGLGLSITANIIKKHYGSIKAESIVGEGSSFIITLPLDITEKLAES
ncbi:MAG: sensor histidine kinase [Chlamydiota bacterium]